MKIGVDIDNVTFDMVTPMLQILNTRFGTEYELEDVDYYSLEKSFGFDNEVIVKAVREVVARHEAPIIVGARQVLTWLSLVCGPLYFISDRPTYNYLSSYKQLENEGLSDNVIILTDQEYNGKSGLYTKMDYVNKLGIDVFIDDKPELITGMLEETDCHVIVFDRPWNEKMMLPASYHMRLDMMRNWGELRDFFTLKLKDM